MVSYFGPAFRLTVVSVVEAVGNDLLDYITRRTWIPGRLTLVVDFY